MRYKDYSLIMQNWSQDVIIDLSIANGENECPSNTELAAYFNW